MTWLVHAAWAILAFCLVERAAFAWTLGSKRMISYWSNDPLCWLAMGAAVVIVVRYGT